MPGGQRVHLLGWSLGGGVVLQYAIDHPGAVASIVLESPMSPYGFGGTRGAGGTPCWPDSPAPAAGRRIPSWYAASPRVTGAPVTRSRPAGC